MEQLGQVWERRLLPLALRLYRNAWLRAVRHSFFAVMPFLLAAAFFDMLYGVFLDPWGPVLGAGGLGLGAWLSGGLTGEAYRQLGWVQALPSCRWLIGIGYGVLSALLAAVLAERLAGIWRAERRLATLCALAAFLLLALPWQGEGLAPAFAQRRFFTALFAAFAAVRLFSWLARQRRLRLDAPACMAKELRTSLALFWPTALTLLAFAALAAMRALLPLSPEAILALGFGEALQRPWAAGLYQLAQWLLWWCGIPGYALAACLPQAAPSAGVPTVFTAGFFAAGMVHLLGLAIAVLAFSRHGTWRATVRFCLPAVLFNVPEPLLFGLPVVLSPFFFLPCLLAPLANAIVGWAAISWGVVPAFGAAVHWSLPVFLGGALGTASVMGGVLQAVWLVLDIFIYAPFVIMANMADFAGESEEAA